MTVAKADQLDDRAIKTRASIGLTFNQWKDLRAAGYTAESVNDMYKVWKRERRRVIDWEHDNADYKDDEGNNLLSAVQVARALEIGEFLVVNMNHRGKLPGVKLGRRTAYTRDAVLALVNQDYSKVPSQRSPLAKSFLRWLSLKRAA